MTVTMINTHFEDKVWSARDENANRSLFENRNFAAGEPFAVSVVPSSAGFGRVSYIHANGANWVASSFLNEGDSVEMY